MYRITIEKTNSYSHPASSLFCPVRFRIRDYASRREAQEGLDALYLEGYISTSKYKRLSRKIRTFAVTSVSLSGK